MSLVCPPSCGADPSAGGWSPGKLAAGSALLLLMPARGAAAFDTGLGFSVEGHGPIKGWLSADGSEKLFFMGERISYPDIAIASWLQWFKRVLGEDSQEWKELSQWDDGHWGRFMQEFAKYERVDEGSISTL